MDVPVLIEQGEFIFISSVRTQVDHGVSVYVGFLWLSYYLCSLSKCIYTGCFNIHGTHVTANIATNYNFEFFSCLWIENSILSQLLILDHNTLAKKGKNIFAPLLIWRQINLKLPKKKMQRINMIMIYYRDKKRLVSCGEFMLDLDFVWFSWV